MKTFSITLLLLMNGFIKDLHSKLSMDKTLSVKGGGGGGAAFQHAEFSTFADFSAGEHAHWPIKCSGRKFKSWPTGNQPLGFIYKVFAMVFPLRTVSSS